MYYCLAAQWSEWGTFSKCQVSCGSGKKSRSRICEFGTAGLPGCEGDVIEYDDCETGVECPSLCPEETDLNPDRTGDCLCQGNLEQIRHILYPKNLIPANVSVDNYSGLHTSTHFFGKYKMLYAYLRVYTF